jgi:glycosyltransferase A (GT-A) superfamily protein (DUF2064 family)
VFEGVPMSVPGTGRAQHDQLVRCGYDVALVPELRDVDTAADAVAVATCAPGTRFAGLVRRFERAAVRSA